MSTPRKRKSFGSRVPAETQGLELELNDQVFKIRSSMSGLALLRVIQGMEGDNEGAAADAMISFISRAFLTEDRERGMAYLEESDPPIGIDDLQEIIQWMVSEYTGNSTDPSQSSTPGSASDGSITTAELSGTELISPEQNWTELDSQQSSPASSLSR